LRSSRAGKTLKETAAELCVTPARVNELVHIPRVEREKGDGQTRDPVRRLRDDRMFSLTVFYGLRVSELAHLRMADIDLRARQLRVAAAKGGLNFRVRNENGCFPAVMIAGI
jgi:integrase